MEIKYPLKTLSGNFFKPLDGDEVIYRVQLKAGHRYQALCDHELGGVKLHKGDVIKVIVLNRKGAIFTIC